VSERRALFACGHHYESAIQVGDHHIARRLARRGWRVAFIGNPISPLHFVRGRDATRRERWSNHVAGGRWHEGGRLWSYVPAALLTPRELPVLRSRFVHERWHRLTWPPLGRRVANEGFDAVDLLYVRESRQAFWLDVLPHRRSVFRVADKDSGFSASTPAWRALEARVAARVDLVAYTSETLAAHVASLAPKRSLLLQNGVDVAHFASRSNRLPDEYRSIPAPRIVYAGSLEAWFDAPLVREVASRLPDASFVVIGPGDAVRRRLEGLPNVHAIGARPFAELPGYLEHAAVGIIPFDVEGHAELVSHVNPLKLYEYLACGLPVVATPWPALASLASPARLARGAPEFVREVRSALASPGDAEERRAFARRHDWDARVDDLLEALGPWPVPDGSAAA
jgi:glycosyltransferase involved in cell wall biosynthesis